MNMLEDVKGCAEDTIGKWDVWDCGWNIWRREIHRATWLTLRVQRQNC